MTKKSLIEELAFKTQLMQDNAFISSINSCLKFPGHYSYNQEVLSKIEKAIEQNTFTGQNELFSELGKIRGTFDKFDSKGLLQGIRERAELISSLYPFNRENDIAYLKLETDKETSILRIYRDAFGILTYEEIKNFDTCSDGVFEFSRGLQSFPDNLYEPEVDPLDKLLEHAELMDFIEKKGGDRKVKVELYDSERDRWSRGEFIPCKIEGNSRTKVRAYDLKDFHFPTKKYFKKECKSEAGVVAEFEGVEGLESVVRTPTIRGTKENIVYFDGIKGSSLFDMFKGWNNKYDNGEISESERNALKGFFLKYLMRDISNIFVEGSKKQIPSFYGNLTGDKLEGWYRNGVSGVLLKRNSNKQMISLIKDVEDFAVKNLKELDSGLLVYNTDPHPRNVIVGDEGFYHIDFESSCYSGMQFDLAGVLSYSELNLELPQKLELLNYFIDYTNLDGKIIESKDEFIDKYFKVEFARALKSSVTRNEWARKHIEDYFTLPDGPVNLEEHNKKLDSLLEKHNHQVLYSGDYRGQIITNPLFYNNYPIQGAIMGLYVECF